MPCSVRAPPWRESARTLLALPATIRHRSFGKVSSLITAPRAHGARTSQGKKRISSGSTALAPNPGEAQGVDHGLVLGRVGPHPTAAQGRPQGGVVAGDDRL